jgi:hypothetical protein
MEWIYTFPDQCNRSRMSAKDTFMKAKDEMVRGLDSGSILSPPRGRCPR